MSVRESFNVSDDSEHLDGSQIGDLGEMAFRECCVRQQLHCSRLEPDRTGKDFIVEWPPAATGIHTTYDKRPPPRRCVVQIKSTGSERPQMQLKQSAAEWLVKDDTPAFVVSPIYRGPFLYQFLVVHVRGKVLVAILRRLREAQRDNQMLSQVSLTLPIDTAMKLPGDGAGLRQYLETQIGESTIDYARAKEKERSEAGYEGASGITMKMRFQVTDLSHIIECLLGDRQLEADLHDVQETRFGIPLPAPLLGLSSRKVKFSVESGLSERWTVCAIDDNDNEIASIEGTARSAALPGMPPEFWRAEFDNGLVSVGLREMKLNVSFGGPEVWEKPTRLSTLRKSVRLWRALVVEDARISMRRTPDGHALIVKPEPVETEHHDAWTKQILKLLDDAHEMFQFCKVDDPEITVESIWPHRRDLRIALAKIQPNQDAEDPFSFSAPAATDLLQALGDKPQRMLLHTMPVIMPPYTLAVAISYFVEMKQADDRIEIASLARFPVAGAALPDENPFSAYEDFIENARERVKPTFHAYYELLPADRNK